MRNALFLYNTLDAGKSNLTLLDAHAFAFLDFTLEKIIKLRTQR